MEGGLWAVEDNTRCSVENYNFGPHSKSFITGPNLAVLDSLESQRADFYVLYIFILHTEVTKSTPFEVLLSIML